MKAAILYIATGKYTVFWKEFYESFEKNFLPQTKKTYFLFTDAKALPFSDRENVCIIPQKNLGGRTIPYSGFLCLPEKRNGGRIMHIPFLSTPIFCV